MCGLRGERQEHLALLFAHTIARDGRRRSDRRFQFVVSEGQSVLGECIAASVMFSATTFDKCTSSIWVIVNVHQGQ